MVIGCPYSCTADPCPGARAHHRLLQHTLTEPETKGCCCWRRQCDLKIKKKDRCFCAALSLVKEQTGEYKRPCGSYCGDGGQSQFHVPRSSNLYINDSCQAVFRDHELEEPEREANRHERRGQNTSTGTWHSGTAERERKREREPQPLLQKVIYHFYGLINQKQTFSFRSAHLPCSSITTASDVCSCLEEYIYHIIYIY